METQTWNPSLVLETRDLVKRYKGRAAVDGVSMHVAKGDIYGFVGENGAGKTTVIRIVTGLVRPNSGAYAVCGVGGGDPGIDAVRHKLGGIVEQVSLVRSMTALDNLKYHCLVTGTKKTDDALIQLIETVGLDYAAIASRPVGRFSLGMRQRIGLAVAMVPDPEILLLDEPLNGLDPQGFVDVREAILNLHRAGVTFLISSHILAELDKICTRIGFLSHGKLLEELSIEELHRMSRKRLLITTDQPEAVRERLTAALGLTECLCEDGGVAVYDDRELNELLRALVELNVPIRGINTREETVEDHYLRLMGGYR